MSALRKEEIERLGPDSRDALDKRDAKPTPAEKLETKVAAANEVEADRKDRHDKQDVESLDARIRRTEARILDRRLVLAAQLSDVNGKVRSKLSSPLLMIAAAGGGFLLAQFARRRRRDRPARDSREVTVKPSIFATLTDALTLATTLLAMMPLIRSKAKEGVQEATGEVPPE